MVVHDCFLKAVFLLSLASLCREGELHTLLRGQEFCSFGPGGHFVQLQSTPFMAKNESAGFWRGPLVVDSWLVRLRVHHALCLVVALCCYLRAIDSAPMDSLWVDPVSRVPCSRACIS